MTPMLRRSSALVLCAAGAIGAPAWAQTRSQKIERANNACAAYGAGFVAVEGTQTCVRIGGHIRVELGVIRPRQNFEQQSPLQTPRADWNTNFPTRIEGAIPAGLYEAR